MIEMSGRRRGAPATSLIVLPWSAGEALAHGESAHDLDASAADVASHGDGPERAVAVVDDDGIAVGGDGLARRGDDTARLVAEADRDRAAGEERARRPRDAYDELARAARRIDEWRGVDDARRIALAGTRGDRGGITDAELTAGRLRHAHAREERRGLGDAEESVARGHEPSGASEARGDDTGERRDDARQLDVVLRLASRDFGLAKLELHLLGIGGRRAAALLEQPRACRDASHALVRCVGAGEGD